MALGDKGTSSSGSSLDSSSRWKYHVFLSFRGETRKNFTDFLYTALVRNEIHAFRDEERLERGEIISEQLHSAIEESLSAIVVLSPEYATSAWCLNELQIIVESRKLSEGLIFPVFYNVEPSDVRYQKGVFAEAFGKHEERYREDTMMVERWRRALRKVADLSGYSSKDRHQSQLVEEIVGDLWKKLQPRLPLHDDELVGIHSRKETILSLLGKDVCFIGIWGMGGIGKTTLARVVYEAIRNEFEIACFLANVREISGERDGLVELQRKLLSCLKITSSEIEDSSSGKNKIRNHLSNRKILLVLDDISNRNQLENLAGNQKWFGQGSKVIITTRDKQLLTMYDVFETYPVPILNSKESLKILHLKAFKGQLKPEQRYMELSEKVVKYAGGLPLALEVLGSFLCRRSILEWEDVLDEIKKIPHEDIMSRLRISYEALDDNKKNIFLNIACFFNGMRRNEVTHILEVCDLHPIIGINVLLERSLLTLHSYNDESYLTMHDMLREMATHIIIQESQNDAGKFSRLWLQNDINHVLEKDKGTKFIQGIVCRFHENYVAHWNPNAFSKMHDVKLLKLKDVVELPLGLNCLSQRLKYLDWERFPLQKFPVGVQLDEVVELRMHSSKIKTLWHERQSFRMLKFIDLRESRDLIQFPNVMGAPLIEWLNLFNCTSLVEVHESVGQLKKLKELKLSLCVNLKKLPSKLEMDSLQIFNVHFCQNLEKLPEFGVDMEFLTELDLRGCDSLVCLPRSIYKLKSLTILKHSKFSILLRPPPVHDQRYVYGEIPCLSSCPLFQWIVLMCRYHLSLLSYGVCTLPPELGYLTSLLKLDLSKSNIVELPCIANLINLYELKVNSCPRLKSVPKLPPNVDWFFAADCVSLKTLSDLQDLDEFFATHSHQKEKRFWFNGPVFFFPGNMIPAWFNNQSYFRASPFYSVHLSRRGLDIPWSGVPTPTRLWSESAMSMNVEIPYYCLSSEWWGIAVCLVLISHYLYRRKYVKIKWICGIAGATLPNPSSDYCFIDLVEFYDPHMCIFLLRGDDRIIQRCLIEGHQNTLQLSFELIDDELTISKCGCRVICEEDFNEWDKARCQRDQNNNVTSTSDLYKRRVREITNEWAKISNHEENLEKEHQDLLYTDFTFEERGLPKV